ncbi:unnamed protein product [Rotaria socialis]|uniref:Uncharacterized protein n=1 Tax=Rotaria socialis TaxID=392032 RepID=A0A820AC44_9BILA|nr:unnamed protein product [Rotaria socialis]
MEQQRGRDLRSEGELAIYDLLPSDRTVRNEVDRAAQYERNLLKTKLVAAADDCRLALISDDDNDVDDDVVDFTSTTIDTLPPPAKAILDMIKDCKSLVKYVKKANVNRERQLEREKQNINDSINGEDPLTTTNNPSKAATLHQLSVVR